MSEPLTEMDAFELRWQLVHGLHPSDGLVVHVVSPTSLMVVGTDSTPHPKHGLYLATGRTLHMYRRSSSWLIVWMLDADQERWRGFVQSISALDTSLAWVRQRADT